MTQGQNGSSETAEKERLRDAPGPDNVTSHGNNPVVSLALFVVVFGVFVAGLYVMGSYSAMGTDLTMALTFLAGLFLCLISLFAAFELIPRFLR